jgi:hypothetical protein
MRLNRDFWRNIQCRIWRLPLPLRPKFSRIVSGSLAAASILVLASGLFLSAQQFLEQRHDASHLFHENRGGGGPPEAREIRPRYEEAFPSGSDSSFIRLRFVFTEFDPTRGAIRGTVAGFIDETAYAKQYFGSAAPKSTELTLRSLFTTTQLEIPLATKDFPESAAQVPLELEVWGEPNNFPGDAYTTAYSFDVGSGMDWASVSVLLGSGLRSYYISGSISDLYLNIMLERRETQRRWVYTLALSPLLLLGALVWSTLRSRDDAVALSIETAVGVLALLPLRQVLVPSDITSITNVDLILGVEFLLFIGWMGWSIVKLNTVSQKATNATSDSLTDANP